LRLIPFEDLCVPLTEIHEGITTFEFRTVHPELSVGEGRCFPAEIMVNVQVTTVGSDFLLDVSAQSEGQFLCDRCGEAFRRMAKGRFKVLFTPDAEKAGNADEEEVRLLSPRNHAIDIRQDVTDALILALPGRLICQENCKGLCPRCGINRNLNDCQCEDEKTDSRWEALRNLSFDDE